MSRPAPHTPVWFMRQAGRSLPEYRAIRGEGSILDAIKRPETAAEITLQPVRRYGVDAAVLYSDIVVPAHAVGFGVDVAPGTGPVAERPLRSRADLARLRPLEPDDIGYVTDTVGLVREALAPDVPVLAFAGAPFTVASYLVEGAPSRDYHHTKALMHRDEVLWHEVLDVLATLAVTFVRLQLDAGAGAFQLFDSWAGALSAADYERFVLPHSRRVFADLAVSHPDAPGIHFGIGCDHLLESMAAAGPTGDRPRLAHHAHRRTHAPRPEPGDPGQPRSGAGARRRATWRSRAPLPCSPTTPGTPATSSTSATACTRRPTPTCWPRSSTVPSHAADDARTAARDATQGAVGVRRDGVRHAAEHRRDRAVLHRHPSRPAAERRAARRSHAAGTRRSAG